MLLASQLGPIYLQCDRSQCVWCVHHVRLMLLLACRAGRTARAGRAGRVFTLLRDEDMRHFKAILRKVDNRFVKDFRLQVGEEGGW